MSKRVLIALAVALLVAGAGWSAMAQKEAPPAIDSVKARLAREVFAQMTARWRNNEAYNLEELELWSTHILEAELDAATNVDERVAAYEAQIKRTADIAAAAKAYAKSGQGLESDALAAEYYRLEALSQSAKGR